MKKFTLHHPNWYRKNRISIHLETTVTNIDPLQKKVITVTGVTFPYDKLLIATGGFSFVPPIKGADHNGVCTLRSVDEADLIKRKANNSSTAVVICGGLLGLEAGNGLRKAGLKVSVVEYSPRLLPRQMDITGGVILKRQLEEMGFTFHLGAKIHESFQGSDGPVVVLDGGQTLSADMVLISAGFRPEVRLSETIGLDIDKGLKVDDTMKTSMDDIYAAGDVIEHRGRFYGIWPAAMAQGRAADANMAGQETLYEGTIPSNALKIAGIDLFATGEINGEEELPSDVFRKEASSIYRKVVTRGNRIVGAIFLGDTRGKKEIELVIAGGIDVDAFKTPLADPCFDFTQLRSPA